MILAKNKQLISTDELTSFESDFNIRIPEILKNFLLIYNGGEAYEHPTYLPEHESFSLREMYCLSEIRNSLTYLSYEELLGIGFLVIGTDFFGNAIAIGIKENDDYGRIFFCDHEFGFKQTQVGDSLVDFFNSFEVKPLVRKRVKTIEERESALIARGYGNNITDGLKRAWQAEIDKYSNIEYVEIKL